MLNRQNVARTNYTTLLMLMAVAILLPSFFGTPGAIASLVLSLMVVAWLVAGRESALQNRTIVIGMAAVVVLVNGIFTASALF